MPKLCKRPLNATDQATVIKVRSRAGEGIASRHLDLLAAVGIRMDYFRCERVADDCLDTEIVLCDVEGPLVERLATRMRAMPMTLTVDVALPGREPC